MNSFQPPRLTVVLLHRLPTVAIAVARRTAALVAAVALVSASVAAQSRPDTVATVLLLARHPWLADSGRFADVQRTVREARESDGAGSMRWSASDGTPLTSTRAIVAHLISDASASRADHADALVLDSMVRQFTARAASPEERGLLDLAVDIAVARRAFVHRQGRLDPSRLHLEWSLAAAELDLRAVRAALSNGTAPGTVFTELEPQARAYQLLVARLREVRRSDADTTLRLPAIPARPLKAGARFDDAPLLAKVLVHLGELPIGFPIASVRNTYSKPLADAVSRWQARKQKSGRPPATLTPAALNTLLTEYRDRAPRLAMAVERWRWLPRTFSNDPLVVNLPEFRLRTYAQFEGDSTTGLSMNVVIGRADSNATPVFAANMTQVVFSPQWHVPKSIMLKEILPAATADAGYLAKNNYELTTTGGRVLPTTRQNIARIGTGVMVRQRSGDANSLGKVKFLLPNPYDIYLHDTPSRSLFSRNRRDFSHGCVRLGDPLAMARYVLGSQPVWTDSKITEAMNAGVEKFVRVPRPIPVLIVYQTAVANPDGSLRFFDDVYGHDRALVNALDRAR